MYLLIIMIQNKILLQLNKEVKKKQKAFNSEIVKEPLPLNDPFAGDSSLGSGTAMISGGDETEERSENELI